MNEPLSIAYLCNLFPDIKGNDVFKLFKEFYNTHNKKILMTWLNKSQALTANKNSAMSTKMHKDGKLLYLNRQFKQSIIMFHQSLMNSEYHSRQYIKALCSRSAAYFMLQLYEECLADIALLSKLKACKDEHLIRKLKCYIELNMFDEYEREKSKHKDDLLAYQQSRKPKVIHKLKVNIPEVNNDTFMFASEKVKLNYDDTRGRHVVTNEDVKPGDILFVEKAFVAVPAPREASNFFDFNCYSCIQSGNYMLPCKTCVYCFYCSEACRDESWASCHKYECSGMHMFNFTGATLPAFKCTMKGMKSNFKFYEKHPRECTQKFGDPNDNYMYFNSLHMDVANFPIKEVLVSAALVVQYLETMTSIFQDYSHSTHFFGAMLTRHLIQFFLNGSTIVNSELKYHLNDKTVLPDTINRSIDLINLNAAPEDEAEDIGSGIYPSISMMNHSCNTNIHIYYINDVAIVRAIDDIPKGSEVFNCYGFDYKIDDRKVRRRQIKSRLLFDCFCQICKNPDSELEVIHDYVYCEYCRLKIVGKATTCTNCNKYALVKVVVSCENGNEFLAEKSIDKLINTVSTVSPHVSSTHLFLYLTWKNIATILEEQGKPLAALKYWRKCLDCVEKRYGKNVKQCVSLLYAIYKDCDNEELNRICKFHYPIEEIQII